MAQVAPTTKIIALLNPQDNVRLQALLRTPIHGCLFRHEIDATLLHGIRMVTEGGNWFSRGLVEYLALAEPSRQPPDEPDTDFTNQTLTRRDQQILACLLRGYDNAQIAAELQLADQTVRNYVNQVCKKLGVPRNKLGKQIQTGS